MDCTFGAGNVNNSKFQREFSRLYFFPPPERFILTHWVRDEHLQLLENPVPLGEIKKMIAPRLEALSKGVLPNVFSPFLELGPNSFTVKVHVKCSADIVITASLYNTEDDSQMKAPNGNSLIHIQREGNREMVNAFIPKKGQFILNISYAEKKCFIETGITEKCLCYVITSENDFSDSDYVGFPEINRRTAVENSFEICGWVCDKSDKPQNECICQAKSVVNMELKAEATNLKCYICEGKDYCQDGRLDSFTRLVSTEGSNIQSLKIIFPSKGWYTVFIDDCDNSEIMKYRVFATVGMAHTIYPRITKEGDSLGVSRVDSEEPVTYSESEPLSIKFHATSELTFSADLRASERSNSNFDTTNHTFISQQDSGIYTVYATLPRGTWKLCVFAGHFKAASAPCVMILEPLYGPLVDPSFIYPSLFPKKMQEYDIVLSESTYNKNCRSEIFQCAFNAPLDVFFSFKLVQSSEPSTRFEEHHVVMNKPKGISSTENMISVLVPNTGEWKLTVYATRNVTDKLVDGVFRLLIEAVVHQPQNVIFPYVTSHFASMSWHPPTAIEQWILPREVYEYPRVIEIEFNQSSEGIELRCETECNQRKCIDEDDLTRITYVEGEQNSIKRTLIVTVKRKGEWKFTVYGRYMDEEKSYLRVLLIYVVIGK